LKTQKLAIIGYSKSRPGNGDCSSNKKIQDTKIAKLQSALPGHPLEKPPGRIFEAAPLSAVAN
jgi:hypothetical protein